MMIFRKEGEKDGDLILRNADGQTAVFAFLELVVVDGREYAALLQRGDTEITVLRLLDDRKQETYAMIEDDDEFEAVLAALEAVFDGED